MKHSRRAAPAGANTLARVGLAGAVLVASAAAVGAAWAAIALRMARRVVTPAARDLDTRILGVDVAAQTIALQRTADTELPGRYGLFTAGTVPYVKVGAVLAADASSVRRKLLTEVSSRAELSDHAAFSGWYFDSPDQLHLPYTQELIGSGAGVCPAWLFPADGDVWVVQVHGWGTRRTECLRAVPMLHALGMPVLVASYRNDGEGPRTRGGTSQLGAAEWQDIDAAIGFARRSGARRVVLMGWSMGGAVVLQTELNTRHPDAVAGLILDSPVVDWRTVLGFQAGLLHLPAPVTDLAMAALESSWARPVTRTAPIRLDRLDVVARATELRDPILILHSDDDGFVPSTASHALAAARPDLVRLETFHGARHTKLWNYDPERWTGAIRAWLAAQRLTPTSPENAGA